MEETSVLKIDGIRADEEWSLFNVWWYSYYKKRIQEIKAGFCAFCEIDPKVNHVLKENPWWRMWVNTVSPRPGQKYQILIASKRHICNFTDLKAEEAVGLLAIMTQTEKHFQLSGYGMVVRSGDYRFNAKTMEHLHVNLHVPDGSQPLDVTLGKSTEQFGQMVAVARLFEKMRLYEKAYSGANPLDCLNSDERALVRDRMSPPAQK